MSNVVFVLHTDDLGNLARLCNLRRCDVAQANMFYQALLLHLCQHGQAGLNRSFRWAMTIPHHNAQVNHIQHVQPEIT